MQPRNLLRNRHLLLRRCGGIRTLSSASFPTQPYGASPSARPSRSHPTGASPPPFRSIPGGAADAGASASWPPPSPSPFPPRPYNPMVPYLIRACRFSLEEAMAAAELLSGKKPPRDRDASSSSKSPLETQIGWLVSSSPPPPGGKNRSTQDAGFSGRTLALITLLDPGAVTGADASRRIGFWRALFRAEADLLRALKSNTPAPGATAATKEVAAVRKMTLLRGCGVSNRDLRASLKEDSEEIARSVDSLEALIKRVEELGLARGRRDAYEFALRAISAVSKRKLEAKLGAICGNRGRGEWKTHQAALGNAFGFPTGSPSGGSKAMKLEDKMEASSASDHSIPLTLSLEKKVMPPYYVLQILKSKDCPGESQASYLLRMCKKARFWTNSYADVNREFQSFMKLMSLLVQGRIAT